MVVVLCTHEMSQSCLLKSEITIHLKILSPIFPALEFKQMI